ncbi:hypothetical protein E4T56_gene120, partial [Termitomyces sp. T112]
NILVLASGSFTHNLRAISRHLGDGPTQPWVTAFADWMHEAIMAGRTCDLVSYRRLAPFAVENHPTDEHLLPLFVALGAAGEGAKPARIHQSTDLGILRMDAYRRIPMANVLVIRSAATGEASVSNKLIDAYLASNPEAKVVERDLDANPVPHVDSASLAGIGRQAPEGEQFAAARALQDEIIGEVLGADVIVIGLPVYNFGMPSTLKAWFDYVARAGTTFQYTAEGPE